MRTVKLNVVTTASLLTLLITTAHSAGPTIRGNVISWTEPGWHQVQRQSTYESICNGGRECIVEPGLYTVINHGTGERFEDVFVAGVTGENAESPPAPVAKTGQTVSVAFGDDGDYQSGAMVAGTRFDDHGDGTFTDKLTGLVWMGLPSCIVKRDWAGAVDYANNLAAASDLCPELDDGSSAGDWRLPNIRELYSLIDLTRLAPVFADGMPFGYSGGPGGTFAQDPFTPYWSSTSFTGAPNSLGWMLRGNTGETEMLSKASSEWVWAVRYSK
ncbi:MAG: DUF1566 domain-containing protein [Granulosicoccus sp.]